MSQDFTFLNSQEVTVFGIGAGKEGQSTLTFHSVTGFMEYDCDGIPREMMKEDAMFVPAKIEFYYISQSTGKTKTAVFFTKGIAGYSRRYYSYDEVDEYGNYKPN